MLSDVSLESKDSVTEVIDEDFDETGVEEEEDEDELSTGVLYWMDGADEEEDISLVVTEGEDIFERLIMLFIGVVFIVVTGETGTDCDCAVADFEVLLFALPLLLLKGDKEKERLSFDFKFFNNSDWRSIWFGGNGIGDDSKLFIGISLVRREEGFVGAIDDGDAGNEDKLTDDDDSLDSFSFTVVVVRLGIIECGTFSSSSVTKVENSMVVRRPGLPYMLLRGEKNVWESDKRFLGCLPFLLVKGAVDKGDDEEEEMTVGREGEAVDKEELVGTILLDKSDSTDMVEPEPISPFKY